MLSGFYKVLLGHADTSVLDVPCVLGLVVHLVDTRPELLEIIAELRHSKGQGLDRTFVMPLLPNN